MFLPYFIALLLGLTNPSHTCTHNNSTAITASSDTTEEEGGGDTGSGPVSGENGQLPPPKP